MKITHGNTFEDITITEVRNYDEDGKYFVEDIIMEFPKVFDIKPISFIETGLLNLNPNLIRPSKVGKSSPTVIMEFFGTHKIEYKGKHGREKDTSS